MEVEHGVTRWAHNSKAYQDAVYERKAHEVAKAEVVGTALAASIAGYEDRLARERESLACPYKEGKDEAYQGVSSARKSLVDVLTGLRHRLQEKGDLAWVTYDVRDVDSVLALMQQKPAEQVPRSRISLPWDKDASFAWDVSSQDHLRQLWRWCEEEGNLVLRELQDMIVFYEHKSRNMRPRAEALRKAMAVLLL